MIEITYWPEKLFVQVDGHAGAGEKGQDIVCAAVSMLACVLAENVMDAQEHGMLQAEPDIYLADGCARVHARPKRAWRKTMRTIFDAICIGFAMAAEQYPDRVKMRAEIGRG